MALIRRKVIIEPIPLKTAITTLRQRPFLSFWGHLNTLRAAIEILGIDISPICERPAILLTPEQLPQLNGQTATEVIIISPEYAPGYRPKIGEETPIHDIHGWSTLQMIFP